MIWRVWSIYKKQIIMRDSVSIEIILVVLDFVKPNDFVDSNFMENFSVLWRVMAVSMSFISLFNWTHKGNKFVWNNPIEVSIFNLLIIFIFFDIECLEVIPAEFLSIFKTLKNVENGALIKAISFWSISEVFKKTVVRFEDWVSLLSTHLQNNDHKCAH
jgi:hypothetical protein